MTYPTQPVQPWNNSQLQNQNCQQLVVNLAPAAHLLTIASDVSFNPERVLQNISVLDDAFADLNHYLRLKGEKTYDRAAVFEDFVADRQKYAFERENKVTNLQFMDAASRTTQQQRIEILDIIIGKLDNVIRLYRY